MEIVHEKYVFVYENTVLENKQVQDVYIIYTELHLMILNQNF